MPGHQVLSQQKALRRLPGEPDAGCVCIRPDEVLKEEIIHQTYTDEKGKQQTVELKRIAWWESKGQRAYEFITNIFELEAAVIAEIYRYGWQIELFLKKN